MSDSTSSSQAQDRGVGFLYMAAAFVIVVAGLRAAESILNPLLLAVFLSVITAPAYFGLIKRKIASWLALLIVIGVLSATLIGVVFFVTGSIASFTSEHQQDHYRDKILEKRVVFDRWLSSLIDFGDTPASDDAAPSEDDAPSEDTERVPNTADGPAPAAEPGIPQETTASAGDPIGIGAVPVRENENDSSGRTDDESLELPVADAQEEDVADASGVPSVPRKPRKSLGEFLYSQFDPGMALSWAASVVGSIGKVLSNVFLILLTVVFILLEVGTFNAKMQHAFVRTEETKKRADQIVESIQHYIVIKTWISLATGILVTLWLIPLKVPHPGLWGLLAFFFNYIPNVGSILAAIPAVLIASLESTFLVGGAVAIGFAIINVAIGNFIEPRVMGKGLGLSPLIVFFSLIFWGWVLGPIGMLLSVPLTMTARIALDGFEDTRWLATLMGNASS
ncbi:MAG: AI-2E family transporter [Fuerstiella sp.]|nr:AI-2E family transporter [Fuerstiella sp.]MCP4788523.1 AI-2E family transporter [Fuerstiella sp.]MCP4854083.1 AI-2E family transporter [Fuerstiella sp.]